MKSIELKIGKELLPNKQGVLQETFLTTYDLLKSVINSPSQQGFSVDEMMKRLRLLEQLDKHKELFEINPEDFTDAMLERKSVLELEDSDYSKLKELFKEMKWGVVSKFIVELNKDFDK